MKNDVASASVNDCQTLRINQSIEPVQLRYREAKRLRKAPQAVLLALVATGLLWSNVLLFWFLGFPVTLTILYTAILFIFGTISWLRLRYRTSRLLFPAMVLLLYEFVVHGVFFQGLSDPQWPRSFALLAMCAGLLTISGRFQISESQLPTLTKWVNWSAYLFGGLGVVQFILANIFGVIWIPLPDEFALGGSNAESDAFRFAGLFRSRGISSEYSYYGLGMVVLVVLCLTLLSLSPSDRRSRSFQYGAILMAVGGVIASVSFTAWAVFVIFLLFYISTNPGIILRHKRLLVGSLLLVITTIVLVAPFLQNRLINILSGVDNSSNYRLRTTIDLMIAPANDLRSILLGTGVGMDGNNPVVWETFEKYLSRDYLAWVTGDRTRLVIVSGWAYVIVTMGWIGLALNMWLIAAVFRGRRKRFSLTLPLFVFSIAYLFAVGGYLSPEWWAWLVLVAALKGVQPQ